jgi:hypothetical protein
MPRGVGHDFGVVLVVSISKGRPSTPFHGMTLRNPNRVVKILESLRASQTDFHIWCHCLV